MTTTEHALGFVDPDEGDGVELVIPEPLGHQRAFDESPARHKVGRCGRRWGKTRVVFKGSMVGHGPMVTERVVYAGRGPDRQPRYRVEQLEAPEPLFRGIMHGFDVAWVVPSYKTANAIWNEEIVPRFRVLEKVGVVRMNETDRFVEIVDHGRLFVVSAENIDAVRGIGANLIGVVVDEAAHLDLAYAHLQVFMPALTDNVGWTMYVSTTNAGLDGNSDRLAPSFFNRLCLEIEQGLRPAPQWAEFTGTAYDNEALDPVAIDALIAEYVPGSSALDQEVYAKLLTAGAGLAFPEWRRPLHSYATEPDEGWGALGGMDWGYASPGAFYVLYRGPGRRILVRRELYFNGPPRADFRQRLDAVAVGRRIGQLLLKLPSAQRPDAVAADSAMWAVTDGGASIAAKVQEGIDAVFDEHNATNRTVQQDLATPQLYPAPKGTGSRAARKQLLHELLAWTPDADGNPTLEGRPALTVHPDCTALVRTLPALPSDPKDPEDVDTTSEDHAYDALTYALIASVPDYDAPAMDRETRAIRAQLDAASLAEADAFDRVLASAAAAERRGPRT